MGVSDFEIEELAAAITGTSDAERDYDDAVEQAIFKKYGVDFQQYCDIVKDLLPLIMVGESPLTKKTYKGFGKGHMLFVKVPT